MEKKAKIKTCIAFLCLLCGTVQADSGWGDSLAFLLNTLTLYDNGGIGMSDSPEFSLNLLSSGVSCADSDSKPFSLNLCPVNRAYADSDNFSFDWLANTACQVGPYRLPAQPSADNKLLVLDLSGNWVTPTSPPPYGATVIIINHGWNGGPWDVDFVDFAHQIAARVPDAYIYTWHWGDGNDVKSQANPNGLPSESDFAPLLNCELACVSCNWMCAVAMKDFTNEVQSTLDNAGRNGWLLGKTLYTFGIRPDNPYNHKIHMIGHSFGGVVSANAATILCAKTHTKIKQLTTIEAPALVADARVYIDSSAAERVEILYYDYHKWLIPLFAFGGPLETNADNVLNLELNPMYPSNPVPLHLRAFDWWYKNTIVEDILNCDNEPFGFGWSVGLNPSDPQWGQDFPLGKKKETEDGIGCLDDMESKKNIVTKTAEKAKDEFVSARNWVGKHATLILDRAKNAVINLITNPLQGQFITPMAASGKLQMSGLGTLEENPDANVAYIYKDINVPPDAQQLFFDYRFISYNPGDTLSLSIDSNTPLVIDADVEGITENYKTSFPVYVGDYAGRTVTIQISLRSTGETLAQVYIDNLRFTAVTITEDINGDKIIDCADLLILTQNWLNVGCNFRNHCDGADIDQDNDVDFADYARLASMWSESF